MSGYEGVDGDAVDVGTAAVKDDARRGEGFIGRGNVGNQGGVGGPAAREAIMRRYEVRVGVELQEEVVLLGRVVEGWDVAVSQARKLGEKFAIVFIQEQGESGMGWVVQQGEVWTWQEWSNPLILNGNRKDAKNMPSNV